MKQYLIIIEGTTSQGEQIKTITHSDYPSQEVLNDLCKLNTTKDTSQWLGEDAPTLRLCFQDEGEACPQMRGYIFRLQEYMIPRYLPTCPHGFYDCIHDPAYYEYWHEKSVAPCCDGCDGSWYDDEDK